MLIVIKELKLSGCNLLSEDLNHCTEPKLCIYFAIFFFFFLFARSVAYKTLQILYKMVLTCFTHDSN